MQWNHAAVPTCMEGLYDLMHWSQGACWACVGCWGPMQCGREKRAHTMRL